jgi:hypothetical protein
MRISREKTAPLKGGLKFKQGGLSRTLPYRREFEYITKINNVIKYRLASKLFILSMHHRHSIEAITLWMASFYLKEDRNYEGL